MVPKNEAAKPKVATFDSYVWEAIKEIISWPWRLFAFLMRTNWKRVFASVAIALRMVLLLAILASITFIVPAFLVLYAPRFVTDPNAVTPIRGVSVAWMLLCALITARKFSTYRKQIKEASVFDMSQSAEAFDVVMQRMKTPK